MGELAGARRLKERAENNRVKGHTVNPGRTYLFSA